MTNYKKQFSKVKLFLERVKKRENPVSQVEYENDLWAFFVFAWTIKDYIKYFVEERGIIGFDVEKIYKEYDSLKICRELANKEKHWKLYDPDHAKLFAVSVFKSTCSQPSLVRYDYIIEDVNNKKHNAVILGEEIVRDWQEVINRLEKIYKK